MLRSSHLLLLFFFLSISPLPFTSASAGDIILLTIDQTETTNEIADKLFIGIAADFGKDFTTNGNNGIHSEIVKLSDQNILGCNADSIQRSSVVGKIVFVKRGNCTFQEKAENLQAKGAAAMIVMNTDDDIFIMPSTNSSAVTLPSAMFSYSSSETLKSHFPLFGTLTRYERSLWDWSFFIMFLIAVATVIAGAYGSSKKEREERQARRGIPTTRPMQEEQQHESESIQLNSYQTEPVSIIVAEAEDKEIEEIEDEATSSVAYLDARGAFGFIVFASLGLLLMFFFINRLIYVIIFMFCVGGVQSVTEVLKGFYRWIVPNNNYQFTLPIIGRVTLLGTMAFINALIIVLSWVTQRKHPLAWIPQDLISICLLLMIQRTLRLPNIKVSSILLSMAFLYDIFWVFLSPYFFTKSVMITVATGGDSGETVPMLLRLPRIDDLLGGYSMLGLGDIALPGLFISYLLRYDYEKNFTTKQSYFPVAVVGYAVGVLATYVGLVLMRGGQPALLYIVPTTLGTCLLLAAYRGDLHEMWSGTHHQSTIAALLPVHQPLSTVEEEEFNSANYTGNEMAVFEIGEEHEQHEEEDGGI